MNRPSEFSREFESLMDTFIIRWDINHAVASKLMRCSPEVQWEVIASKPPRKVYNPNGFVMSRIAKAKRMFSDPPQLCGSNVGSADHHIRGAPVSGDATQYRMNSPVQAPFAPVTLVQARPSEVVEVSESPLPLTEKSPS